MKIHYQAPWNEALKAAGSSALQRESGIEVRDATVPFEGQSTTHEDYRAPPLEKLSQFLRQPPRDEAFATVPFEGESSMKAHYIQRPQQKPC